GANTFGGGMFINGGRVNLNNNGAAGAGDITLAPSGSATVSFGSTSGTIVIPNNVVLNPGSGTIDFLVTSSLTINGLVSGNSGLAKGLGGGAGTLGLTNVSTSFTGPITINAGTLAISSDSALGPTSNNINLGGLPNQTTNSALLATANLT